MFILFKHLLCNRVSLLMFKNLYISLLMLTVSFVLTGSNRARVSLFNELVFTRFPTETLSESRFGSAESVPGLYEPV